MKNNNLRFVLLASIAVFCASLFFPASINAQRRDHLSEMETELVRFFQEIDKRTEVYIKAIDRRFLVLNKDNSQAKRVEKDLEKWGELPKGTRGELLIDIEKILQEAIDNIDNIAERDAKSELLPKAVRTLAKGAQNFLPQLKLQIDKPNTNVERGAILGAIEYCNQIIEAAARVPADEKKTKKKKKDD